LRGAEQRLVAFVVDRADKGIGGDPIGPTSEDRDAVQHEPEEVRPWLVRVRRLVQTDGAHAHALTPAVEYLLPVEQRDFQVVKRRLSDVVRPPQMGVFDLQVDGPFGLAIVERGLSLQNLAVGGDETDMCERRSNLRETVSLDLRGYQGSFAVVTDLQGVEM